MRPLCLLLVSVLTLVACAPEPPHSPTATLTPSPTPTPVATATARPGVQTIRIPTPIPTLPPVQYTVMPEPEITYGTWEPEMYVPTPTGMAALQLTVAVTPLPTLVARPPTVVVEPLPTPQRIITLIPPSESTATATATPAPSVAATATPIPIDTPTPTPVSRPTSLTASELADLRLLALELINTDRLKHGVAPVRLGTNTAAQSHADDMLANDYIGHWWTDGRKPYMVYSEMGGTSYVRENVAWRGWTRTSWAESDCDSPLVNCILPLPRESVEDLHYRMMYDDAHADWGHRDTIIGSTHRVANIGIGFNGRSLTFVQHFEGSQVRANGLPTLSSSGVLRFSLSKVEQGVRISSQRDGMGNVVGVFHDPWPTPKTPAQIDGITQYCVGGGFTPHCADAAVRILEPLPDGWEYAGLAANEVVASRWRETADGFELQARLGHLEPGVYTATVWQDSGGDRLTEVLMQLSVYRR